jgi:hypothetical protein
MASHAAQEVTIPDAGPPSADHGLTIVATEFRGEIHGGCSSGRTRTGQERVAGQIEGGNGLFAPHGGELAQKFVKGVPALQVGEQRLDRHTRANEGRRSAENIGVAVNNLTESRHDRFVASVKHAQRLLLWALGADG